MVEVRKVRLGDVAYEHKERIGEEAPDRPVYGVDKSVGLTAEPRYQSSNLSRYKRIEYGMFAYNPMRLNIGSIGFCHADLAPGIVSPDYVVFGCRKGALLPKFMDYHTRSAPWCDWLSLAGEGSVRERIYFRKLETYELALPDVAYQEAAVEILSSLDNKIELNQRMNETLEALAQAVFKDWFVDFGPTRRKMEGAIDPVAILGGLVPDPSRATPLAAFFPDNFSEDGLPEGWKKISLLDLADWVNGAAYKNMHFVPFDAGGLPVIKIAELKAGVTQNTRFTNTDLGERYRIRDGELLFSWSGNPDTSIDAFIWTAGDAWLNQHIFAVRMNGKRSKPSLYVMLKFFMPEFAEIARNKQTTGLGHVTKSDMSRTLVPEPPLAITQAFSELVEPIYEGIVLSLKENHTLAETRDYLLPKLMSGEVLVRDAEKLAE
ncbi:restriction endonuclease subunit S [Notoacmeibacter sp. MSK16QG-6]|uniref:restriction endonuclease subunit S n=1 Tax=Notoacmeibacter sp. MSK16QG-6 TaxID=2957982 RepID=UPI00209D5846|nr:restriction endonuclease subunit S [Notoacmeibacter sp. MSK16QG-6]MCP1199078.1 restriction endonuclease subunit S [Notoacmeibacter sp. MSK16QG-6]